MKSFLVLLAAASLAAPPAAAQCPVVTVAPGALPNAAQGQPYSAAFTASSTPAGTYTFTQTGLPANLSLSSAGVVSGTPSAAGASVVRVVATGATGCVATHTLPLRVCAALTVARTGGGSFPAGTYNTAYTGQSVTATGGSGTYTYAVTSGALPGGLSLSSGGAISGTPLSTGTFAFTVTATDAATTCTGAQAFSVAIRPVAVADAYTGLVNNTQALVPGGATSTPATPAVTLSGTLVANDLPAGGVSAVPATLATAQGGSVTIASDGTFLYTPPAPVAAALTTDSFTYTASSNTGGTATATTATATATLTLSGRVWYVNNATAAGTNDGRSNTPFKTMTAAGAAPTSNGDTIYVHTGSGTTTGAISLKTSQTLWGQGAAFTLGNLTIAAGTKPTLGGTVTLNGNGVTVSSLDISTGASTGFTNTGAATSAATVKNGVTVTTTTAAAVSLSGLDASALSFRAIGTANGGATSAANAVLLTNVNTTTGSFTVTGDGTSARNASGGTIDRTSGDSIRLTNTKNVSLTAMAVTNTAANGVNGAQVTNFTWNWGQMTNVGMGGAGPFADGISFLTNVTGTENNIDGTVTITNSAFTTMNRAAINMQNFSGTISAMNVSGNTFTTIVTSPVAMGTVTNAWLQSATVANNTINASSTAGSPGINFTYGVAAAVSPMSISVTGNAISNTDGNGILVTARGGASRLHATIQNNNVGAPLGTNRPGIRVDAGNGSSTNDQICLTITGNTSAGNAVAGIGVRKQGTVLATNTFAVLGASGTPPLSGSGVIIPYIASVNTGGAFLLNGDNFTNVCPF